jgi:hypothetical protein
MLPKWVVRTIVAVVLTEIIRLIFPLIRTWQPPIVPGSLRPWTATESPPPGSCPAGGCPAGGWFDQNCFFIRLGPGTSW